MAERPGPQCADRAAGAPGSFLLLVLFLDPFRSPAARGGAGLHRHGGRAGGGRADPPDTPAGGVLELQEPAPTLSVSDPHTHTLRPSQGQVLATGSHANTLHSVRVLVKRGTAYPTKEPVARVTVKATHDEQRASSASPSSRWGSARRAAPPVLGVRLRPPAAPASPPVSPTPRSSAAPSRVDGRRPTFLTANPSAAQGEPRFSVEFGVDANKRLTITARDLRTGCPVYREHPVVRLT